MKKIDLDDKIIFFADLKKFYKVVGTVHSPCRGKNGEVVYPEGGKEYIIVAENEQVSPKHIRHVATTDIAILGIDHFHKTNKGNSEHQ